MVASRIRNRDLCAGPFRQHARPGTAKLPLGANIEIDLFTAQQQKDELRTRLQNLSLPSLLGTTPNYAHAIWTATSQHLTFVLAEKLRNRTPALAKPGIAAHQPLTTGTVPEQCRNSAGTVPEQRRNIAGIPPEFGRNSAGTQAECFAHSVE